MSYATFTTANELLRLSHIVQLTENLKLRGRPGMDWMSREERVLGLRAVLHNESFVPTCGGHKEYCTNPWPKNSMKKHHNTFFSHPPANDTTTDEDPSIRVCLTRVATLAEAGDVVRLIGSSLEEESGAWENWGRGHVVYVEVGHHDGATQRDTRDFAIGELPLFLSGVRDLRRSEARASAAARAKTGGRTSAAPSAAMVNHRIRVVLDVGPALSSRTGSTGWRSNIALAALSAFVRRALSPDQPAIQRAGDAPNSAAAFSSKGQEGGTRPLWNYDLPADAGSLGVEMLPGALAASLTMTMPLRDKTADGLHYLKATSNQAGPSVG